MSATREQVHFAIDCERAYQEQRWGDAHDRAHALPAWLVIAEGELQEAKRAWLKEGDAACRLEILQVAAVCVAALEVHGVTLRGSEEIA